MGILGSLCARRETLRYSLRMNEADHSRMEEELQEIDRQILRIGGLTKASASGEIYCRFSGDKEKGSCANG